MWKKLASLAACLLALACSDDGSTSTGGNEPIGGSDGGSPSGGALTGGAAMGPPDCYSADEALVVPDGVWSGVSIDQGVCDATQIDAALTECLPPGTVDTCEAWTTANPECSLCILGGSQEEAPFPVQVLIGSNTATYLALYACQAFASDLPQCAVQYQNLLFCVATACESCESSSDGVDCSNFALNDQEACGMLPLDDECLPLLDATELPAECIGDATSFAEAYPILAAYFCGAR